MNYFFKGPLTNGASVQTYETGPNIVIFAFLIIKTNVTSLRFISLQ